MSYNKDYEKFSYYIEDGIDNLRDTEGWSDKKIAKFLRDEARSLDPPKPRRKTIDPLTITDKELSKYPKEVQDKVRKAKEDMLNKLKEISRERLSQRGSKELDEK